MRGKRGNRGHNHDLGWFCYRVCSCAEVAEATAEAKIMTNYVLKEFG